MTVICINLEQNHSGLFNSVKERLVSWERAITKEIFKGINLQSQPDKFFLCCIFHAFPNYRTLQSGNSTFFLHFVFFPLVIPCWQWTCSPTLIRHATARGIQLLNSIGLRTTLRRLIVFEVGVLALGTKVLSVHRNLLIVVGEAILDIIVGDILVAKLPQQNAFWCNWSSRGIISFHQAL